MLSFSLISKPFDISNCKLVPVLMQPPPHKTLWGAEVYQHAFLRLVPVRFILRQLHSRRMALDRKLGGPKSHSGCFWIWKRNFQFSSRSTCKWQMALMSCINAGMCHSCRVCYYNVNVIKLCFFKKKHYGVFWKHLLPWQTLNKNRLHFDV